jgi:hypothetical protein
MKLAEIIPTPQGLSREVLTTLAGALIAAWVINHSPRLKAYFKAAFG